MGQLAGSDATSRRGCSETPMTTSVLVSPHPTPAGFSNVGPPRQPLPHCHRGTDQCQTISAWVILLGSFHTIQAAVVDFPGTESLES